MATSHSEDDKYLGLYREALSNCEEQIIRGLRVMVLSELTKVGGLTDDELRDIEVRCHDKASKAKDIITLLRRKDTLKCYIALSRLLCELPTFDQKSVFPFVVELEKAGKHPPIQRLAGLARTKVPEPCSVGTVSEADCKILWVVESSQDCRKLLEFCSCKLEKEIEIDGFHIKTVLIKVKVSRDQSEHIEVPLSIAIPCENTPKYNNLLSRFQSAQLVLLSAAGVSIGSGPPSDVVVVTRKEPTIVCAEVEHITTLWRFEKQVDANISFSRATSKCSHENPEIKVSSERVISFYNAADKLNINTLAVTHQQLATDSESSSLKYCLQLVHHFLNKFLESFYS